MVGPRDSGGDDAEAPGQEVQKREGLVAEPLPLSADDELICLEWQGEMETALEDIDGRLPVKHRRATDPPDSAPFPRPEFRSLTITPEILEALAVRVAERLKAHQEAEAMAVPVPPPHANGRPVMTIRFRWPLFSLRFFRPFRRRRRSFLTRLLS